MAQSYARAQGKNNTCAIHSEFLSAAARSNMDKPWRRPDMIEGLVLEVKKKKLDSVCENKSSAECKFKKAIGCKFKKAIGS